MPKPPPQIGEKAASDSTLRSILLGMGKEDQSVRRGLSAGSMEDTAFLRRMLRTDSALSLRLRELIRTHGWPEMERVGPDALNAAFLIVQHSPFDEFREKMLPYIRADVRAGNLDGQDYALLVDRIRIEQGERQLYGTQYSVVNGVLVQEAVADPETLEARRAEIGLMPIADYEKLLSEAYDMPVEGN